MPSKKSVRSVAKKPTKKSGKRGAKKRVTRGIAVIDHGAMLSPYGKNVLHAFSDGVQLAFAKMASAGIRATVVVDGEVVRAVPHREGGRFVVSEPTSQSRLSRHRVR